jgi:hypothetical protein
MWELVIEKLDTVEITNPPKKKERQLRKLAERLIDN